MTDTSDPVSEPKPAPAESEPVEATPAPIASEAAREEVVEKPAAVRRVSVLPMVLGGFVAAALGFGVAQVVPTGWPLAEVSTLSAEVKGQSEQFAALAAKVTDLANVPAPKLDPSWGDRLTKVEEALAALPPAPDTSALMQRLDALEQQISGLSALPVGTASPVDGAGLARIQAELDALKTSGAALDAKMVEAGLQLDSIKVEAQAVVLQAARRAAAHQLLAAVDSGAPFGSALADLAGNDLPEILTARAQTGIPSLQSLRETFPDAARAALDASLRATSSDSWADRASVFLRGQTGARSLVPREGTDPDAVFSRAEAALSAGDLSVAMTELEGLPDVGKAAMADWLAFARQRLDAVAAVQALAASVER